MGIGGLNGMDYDPGNGTNDKYILKLQSDLEEWKAQAEKLSEALEWYKGLPPVMNGSDEVIYGDASFRAKHAITQYQEFKKGQE